MVYLPMDRFRKKARGFGFVNFVSCEAASRCMSVFEGFRNWGTTSTKVCTVEWGVQQGDLHSQVLLFSSKIIENSTGRRLELLIETRWPF